MTQPIIFRAGPQQPCPVCGSPSKGCSATEDGLHLCRGEPVSGWRRVTDSTTQGDFSGYRRDDDTTYSSATKPRRKVKPKIDWDETARRYAGSMRPADREFIAGRLGVPVESIDQFPLIGSSGANSCGPVITFPERDGRGNVVGISERTPGPDGRDEKKSQPYARRGLSIADGWRDRPGPVFLVEGPSDTLAMTAAGLAAIGRPSNSGGVELLAELLRTIPADREIIVVGENDRVPGRVPEWPGRDGALSVAANLAADIGRPVRVAMPPPPAKDVRAWLTDSSRSAHSWADRGADLCTLLSAPSSAPPPPTTPIRKRIVAGFREFEVNDQAIAAIAEHSGTFTRGGTLVHVAWQPSGTLRNSAVHVPAGPKISILSKSTLRERLTVVADWREERASETGRTLVESRPPDWCTSAVLDRGCWAGIKPLIAIAEFPCFLPDGSILSKPGYDESSGLFYFPVSPVDIEVKESPTEADAEAALETIAEAICDFPFVDDHHRSAWLAGLLTPLARYAFSGPSPLFLVEANVPGAGKGLLVNTANLIVRGDAAAVLEFSRDAEELQKVLTALLIQGESIASFDNVEGSLGGGVLNKLLTAELWEGRVLGTSSTVRVPNLCTWWCTGNNISVLGDTARRVCSIRLESALENPEDRTDLHHEDLPAWVRANRSRLLSAALTLLRAFHIAGRPRQDIRAWGSYGAWSKLIRETIVWAGWPDPLGDGTTARQEDDPVRGAMHVLMEQWGRIDASSEGLTAAGIIQAIESSSPIANDELFEAIEILAPKSSKNRVSKLGYTLRHFYRRTIGPFRLDHKKGHKKIVRWFITSAHGGDGGYGGDGSAPSQARPHAPARAHDLGYTSPPSPPSPPHGSNGHVNGIDLDIDSIANRTEDAQ